MTDSTPIGLVGAALEEAGYVRLANGVCVGGLAFNFPAAFVQAKSSADLILVADTTLESETQLTRKVDGVARALDIAGSNRSLTLIVTGPRPSGKTLESMSRVCRVLPTGHISHGSGSAALKNWLAVLLPLELPKPETVASNSLGRLREEASSLDESTRRLIDEAVRGSEAVKAGLYSLIDEAARSINEEGT